jgi:hypothetical protein
MEKFPMHSGRREVLVAAELDRPITFRDDLALPHCFHKALLLKDRVLRLLALGARALAGSPLSR